MLTARITDPFHEMGENSGAVEVESVFGVVDWVGLSVGLVADGEEGEVVEALGFLAVAQDGVVVSWGEQAVGAVGAEDVRVDEVADFTGESEEVHGVGVGNWCFTIEIEILLTVEHVSEERKPLKREIVSLNLKEEAWDKQGGCLVNAH